MDEISKVVAGLSPDAAATLTLIVGAISAMAALGLASYALVDASKILWGGIANIGFKHILDGCKPFEQFLQIATGDQLWQDLLRAQWRNGRDKEAQKALARSLVRLGMTEESAQGVTIANIQTDALRRVVRKATSGDDLNAQEVEIMGRVDAVVGFHIDAAFERADQQYRNAARVIAGIISMMLAIGAAILMNQSPLLGAMVGILSVPIAPLAKDLTSAMTAAVGAVKAVRRGR
jgi:hypothetical protein